MNNKWEKIDINTLLMKTWEESDVVITIWKRACLDYPTISNITAVKIWNPIYDPIYQNINQPISSLSRISRTLNWPNIG